MELDELEKSLQWLITEHRKDKQTISELIGNITFLTEELNKQKSQFKPLENEIKKASQNSVRSEEFDEVISRQKLEFSQGILEIEKKYSAFEKKFEKIRKDDLETVSKRLLDLQTELKPLAEIKKALQSRADEDFRINQKIDDAVKQLPEFKIRLDDLQQTQKIMEDSNRIGVKQLTDVQIELSALRKKIEEEQTTVDSQKEFIRKLEHRLNELATQEQTRKQDQVAFIESQSRQLVAHENLLKDWDSRLGQHENLGAELSAKIAELDVTHRRIKQSQGEFEELKQRLDRRLNEITEMNRLSEEHFKQEWVAFKADDQKRWTNYSLLVDEHTREGGRETSKILERLAHLEDHVQVLIDSIDLANQETEKRIKGFLALSNDLMSSFEQTKSKRK